MIQNTGESDHFERYKLSDETLESIFMAPDRIDQTFEQNAVEYR
jgi:hypothetical protein